MYLEKISQDGLLKEVWRFDHIRNLIVLSFYSKSARATKRHGFALVNRYDRLMRGSTIALPDVPFTNEIKQEALSLFISQIKVVSSI